MRGRNGRTTKNRNALIDSFRSGNAIGTSCAIAGISVSSYYDWRYADAEFAAACDEALDYGTDMLEDIAKERAIRQSDTLMIFLLKARRPDKYRERVDINLATELRSLAEKAAADRGLDEAAVVAEAERLLAESR